jgi:glycosyltransferase involved in cell wall biosynthesis
MPTLSSAVLSRTADAPSLDQQAVVLQVGPALGVRGGISSVEKLIVSEMSDTINVHHIASSEDGSSWRKLGAFMRAIGELAAALRRYERAVVHIHFSARGSALRKVVFAWMALRARKPLILHAHSGSFDTFFRRLPRGLQNIVKRVFSRADCFVVLSTQWHEFYTRELGIPVHLVRVLPNPTRLPEALPSRAGREKVQFLFLGRISTTKGAFVMFEAFAALPPHMSSRVRLVFAGDGEVEKLRALAKQYSYDIDVHSWVDSTQRDALLAASDVFVLPSFFEGLPMSLLEAMAAGLPVITTPVGGIPDVVTNGTEGLLVQPGDVQALRDAMCTLIEDEPRRLEFGKRARAKAEQFDVSHYALELTKIYRKVLG